MCEPKLEFNVRGEQNNATNLALGHADYTVDETITNALSIATISSVEMNQYTRQAGHPRLVNILAKIYSNLTGRSINSSTEILITVGGYEAIFCAIYGHVNPGDEVIIIEPFFENYIPVTNFAQGKPVFVPLRPKNTDGELSSRDWIFDEEELRSKFNCKTKMIILNTPHNPTGKIFTSQELQFISKLAIKYNTLVLMDEVYEWMIFDGNNHIRMNTLPGMWNRTITVGSSGKSFSATGWKIGYAYGPEHLIMPMRIAHQYTPSICSTPLQEALAVGYENEYENFNQPSSYFYRFAYSLQQKRDLLANMLSEVHLKAVIPEAGVFKIVDFSDLPNKINFTSEEG
ncbi:Kynurenine--oxoglutarate transaminase 3-like protein, partial [Leptotrombidium deliense]